VGLWVNGWGENAGDTQADLECKLEGNTGITVWLLLQVSLTWADLDEKLWNCILCLSLEKRVVAPHRWCSGKYFSVTCCKHRVRGIGHEGRCKILTAVPVVTYPLFMVLSILSPTENSVLTAPDLCGTDLEVFLVWFEKALCVLENDVALCVWWWILNWKVSELRREKRFAVSNLLGSNSLFVITLWLGCEAVWLRRWLRNVFGGAERTYEEWVGKAAFQFHSFQSSLVPLPSRTAYFCAFKEKEKKKSLRRESCVRTHFLPGFPVAFHWAVCLYRGSRYKLVR